MTPHRVPVSLHARKVYQRTIIIIALGMWSCVIHTPNQHHPITRINLENKSYVTTVTSTVRSGVYPTTEYTPLVEIAELEIWWARTVDRMWFGNTMKLTMPSRSSHKCTIALVCTN